MREPKGPPESGNSTEYGGDTSAETEGPEGVVASASGACRETGVLRTP
jgi:hypothetical protein